MFWAIVLIIVVFFLPIISSSDHIRDDVRLRIEAEDKAMWAKIKADRPKPRFSSATWAIFLVVFIYGGLFLLMWLAQVFK